MVGQVGLAGEVKQRWHSSLMVAPTTAPLVGLWAIAKEGPTCIGVAVVMLGRSAPPTFLLSLNGYMYISKR